MDIEQFYDGDPRRRASVEVELGRDWHDASEARYELNWVQDTGELYVMREPVDPIWEDPFGDMYLENMPTDELAVAVIGLIPTHDRLEEVLGGWEDVMSTDNSVAWIAERLAATSTGAGPVEPSDLPPAPRYPDGIGPDAAGSPPPPAN